MLQPRKDEIKNLIKLKTIKVLIKEKVPQEENTLPGRFALKLKSTINGTIIHQDLFVIGGNRDNLNKFMAHSSQRLQHSSIRRLMGVAWIHGFIVSTSDVTQANFQSAIPLSTEVLRIHIYQSCNYLTNNTCKPTNHSTFFPSKEACHYKPFDTITLSSSACCTCNLNLLYTLYTKIDNYMDFLVAISAMSKEKGRTISRKYQQKINSVLIQRNHTHPASSWYSDFGMIKNHII